MKRVYTPMTLEVINELRAGDTVLINGVIYTARDAAHKRLVELIDKKKPLPIDLKDTIIYYVGPTPEKPGQVIGSAGPTTSYRMDDYTPKLINMGLRGMIGKGIRSQKVIDSMVSQGAVYFAAIGGTAALMAKSIVKSEIIAYKDLGSEAIRRLEVVDLPVVVAIDAKGNNLYEIGQREYKENF